MTQQILDKHNLTNLTGFTIKYPDEIKYIRFKATKTSLQNNKYIKDVHKLEPEILDFILTNKYYHIPMIKQQDYYVVQQLPNEDPYVVGPFTQEDLDTFISIEGPFSLLQKVESRK